MQKLTANYNQFTLWSMLALIIVAPIYVAFDLGFRQSYETEKIHEEYIKKGSFLYAEFCKACHGVNGGGITEDAALPGLPLNQTAAMTARDSKDPFIVKTISRGRRNTQMPAWLKEEGGPLDIEDVKMLRAYILAGNHWGQFYHYTSLADKNWKPSIDFAKLTAAPVDPNATPERKGQLFAFSSNGPCSVCHNTTAEVKVGPGLAGLFAGGKKLPNGKEVNEENLREWIQKGSSSYTIAAGKVPMPPYEASVKGVDLDNVLAYLKTLK